MAKNIFDVFEVEILSNGDFRRTGEKYKNVSFLKLLEMIPYMVLDKSHYLVIIGNLDVSGYIKKNSVFDDSWIKYTNIKGDFKCSKFSKNFPNYVSGCFDCSNCDKGYIDKNTVFPLTRKINCAYSIRDFDDLFGLMRGGLEMLVVEPKLIKKSYLLESEEHFVKALSFMELYPTIKVVDTNYEEDKKYNMEKTLEDVVFEIFDEIEVKKSQQLVDNIENIPEQKKQVLPLKIKEKHLERREVYIFCRINPDFDFLSDDELNRLVRIVWSENRLNGLDKQKMRDDNGKIVECINISQISIVYSDIKSLLQERKKTIVKEENPVVENAQNVEQEEIIYEPEVKPIKIKKYITERLYDSVSKTDDGRKKVMRIMNEVNLNPMAHKQGPNGRIFILKDGELVLSDRIKRETGCCFVQSIDGPLGADKKRLLWRFANGPKGMIFICEGFVLDHEMGKAKADYINRCRKIGEKKTYTEMDLRGYKEIEEFLDDDLDGMPPDGPSKNDHSNKSISEYETMEKSGNDSKISDSLILHALDMFRRRQ